LDGNGIIQIPIKRSSSLDVVAWVLESTVDWVSPQPDAEPPHTPQTEADARLLAASWDLLQALEEVVAFLESDDGGSFDIVKAKVAIAKAVGDAV
jgi:hypothetical protein